MKTERFAMAYRLILRLRLMSVRSLSKIAHIYRLIVTGGSLAIQPEHRFPPSDRVRNGSALFGVPFARPPRRSPGAAPLGMTRVYCFFLLCAGMRLRRECFTCHTSPWPPPPPFAHTAIFPAEHV